MARMRLRFCKCGAMVDGICEKCKKESHDKTTTERGYGSDWQKLSKRIRYERPLCEDCLGKGRTTPSVHVHHKVTIEECRELRLEETNLVALCEECHAARHGVSK